MNFAKKLLENKILLDNICDGKAKQAISVMDKILFLTNEYNVISPKTLINKLGIAKSNLALTCRELINKNLLISVKDGNDKRQIYYKLTDLGQNSLDNKLKNITDVFRDDEKSKIIFDSLSKINEFLNRKI